MSKDFIDRAELLAIIEKIDHFRLVQGQNWAVAKYPPAIEAAEEIIDLALEARMYSIVKEQRDFIRQFISDYVRPKKVILDDALAARLQKSYERSLISEEELEIGEIPDDQAQRAIELENTRKKLEELDTEFYNAMMNKDMDNAGEIIEQAKGLITELLEESIKKKWKENEKEYLNQKNYADLIEKIEKGIEKVNRLKDEYKFNEAISKVDELIDLIKYEDLPEYIEKLNKIRKELVDAESEYNKLSKELERHIKEFKKNREKKLLKEAIKNCEDIINIAEKIGKDDIAEEYRQILEELRNELEKTSGLLVDIKHMIEDLSKEGLKLLYDGKVVSSFNKYHEVVKEFDKIMG